MTIKEIAHKAGVSIGTVDRVLHNRGRVATDTIKKVNTIIKKYGYKPNIFASNLSLSKSYQFGILMPYVHQDTKYWSIPEKGIITAHKKLIRYNVNIKFFLFDKYDPDSFMKACNKILASDIDGLLIAPVLSQHARKFLKERLSKNIPCVLFDSDLPETDYLAYIGQDSYKSGFVAAKLMSLLTEKDETIAVIRVVRGDYHINERARGFKEYFHSYKGRECIVYDIEDSDDYAAFKSLGDHINSTNHNRLRGIFVTNDSVHYMARYIYEEIKNKKIHLIGYDLIENNIAYLKKDIIDFLISQHSFDQGYNGIHTLFNAVVLKENVKKTIMMPIDIIVKENLVDYQNRYDLRV
jgi:LacI family transcriptional regulator